MARPISWQSDLSEIHRRVQDSPRSLYTREDLERVFGIQERAARALIELMPRFRQANSVVVEREDLLRFLTQAMDAEDLRAYLDGIRKDPPRPSRRKLRIALPRQLEAGNLASIDRWSIELRRGRITLHFTTLADVASKLLQLAQVIDAPEFERRFCDPAIAPAVSAEQERLRSESAMLRAHNRYFIKLAASYEAENQRLAAAEEEAAIFLAIRDDFRAEAAAALEDYRRLAQALGLEPEDLERLAERLPRTSKPGSS